MKQNEIRVCASGQLKYSRLDDANFCLDLQKDQIPNVSKMLKENREEDTYTLVIQTEPLFAEPDVDSGNTHEATLTIDDLECKWY